MNHLYASESPRAMRTGLGPTWSYSLHSEKRETVESQTIALWLIVALLAVAAGAFVGSVL